MRIGYGRFLLPTLLLLIVVAACTARQSGEYRAQWKTPHGAWQVNAQSGKTDLYCETLNRGPNPVELVQVRRQNGPDLSSSTALIASLKNGEIDPETIAGKLTEFVHGAMRSGRRDESLLAVYRNPLAALAVAGQGFPDDLARVLAVLCHEAGLEAKVVDLDPHAVTVVKWDGVWHLADPTWNVLFADRQGAAVSLRELSLRPDLIRWNLAQNGNAKNAKQIAAIINNGLQFDDESRWQTVAANARALSPWPLPPGASVRFGLHEPGTNTGLWQMALPDPQGRYSSPLLKMRGLDATESGWRVVDGETGGTATVTVQLPHPVTLVEIALEVSAKPAAKVEVFVYRSGEGVGETTQVLRKRVDGKIKLTGQQRFIAPAFDKVTCQVNLLGRGVRIDSFKLAMQFPHGRVVAPVVAGTTAAIEGTARSEGEAELETRHCWQ